MNESYIKTTLRLIAVFLALIFCMVPFLFTIITSVSANPDYLAQNVPFIMTLDHYRSVLGVESLHFRDFLFNSFCISLLSAGCCTLIASLAAYALTRLHIYAPYVVLVVVLAVSMFPQLSLVSYLFQFMSAVGWINTYAALVFPYIAWTLPLSLWILVSYFSQIPKELDKAALVDGCSSWQTLYKVILPVAKPGMLSAFLISFIYAFNELMFALVLTFDHQARTIPVGIALFEGLHGEIPWGTIMAASTLSIIPLVIVTIIFQRHIIKGLTAGAVKG